MDELRERLAEIADLERVEHAHGLGPGGVHAARRRARRAGSCAPPSGAWPTSASPTSASASCWQSAAPRDELEADIVRVARRDFDKARARPRRARGRDGPRRRGRARRVAAGARGQRLRALRALPGAQHRAAPALQRVLSRGRAPLRPAARRLRAGHDARPTCARPRAPARRPGAARGLGARGRRRRAARARSPRPASARWSTPCCAPSASTIEQWRVDEADPPVRGHDRRGRTCG